MAETPPTNIPPPTRPERPAAAYVVLPADALAPGATFNATQNNYLLRVGDIHLPGAQPVNYPDAETLRILIAEDSTAAAKITDSFVEEGRERRQLNRHVIDVDAGTVRLRLILVALLVALFAILAFFLIMSGHALAGSVFTAIDVGAVLIAILTGRGKPEGGPLEQIASGIDRLRRGDDAKPDDHTAP